jgi:hypothetical protein
MVSGLMVGNNGGLVDEAVRWFGQAVDWKKVQGGKRQKGRDWGVQTHHDFGGAERQSISYTNRPVSLRVSNEVGSVYLSINSSALIEGNGRRYFC